MTPGTLYLQPDFVVQGGKTFAAFPEHHTAVQRLRLDLKYLNPEPVVEHLYSKGALTLEQKESIQSKPTKTSKNTALLDIIEQKPDWVYCCLLDVLLETEQEHVVKILKGGKNELLATNINMLVVDIQS